MMNRSENTAKATRVLIVEDHAMFGQLLADVISSEPGFAVVGRACGEADTLRLCGELNPDVLILDLVLAQSSGLTVIAKLRARSGLPNVLVCSGNLSPEAVREALEIGVIGLIEKTARLEEFRSALLAVAGGRTYFSSEVAATMKELVIGQSASAPVRPRRLTRREQTVLAYVVRGMTSREIAETLGVSFYTVANHRSRLLRKFGLQRATQLSHYATRRNLLPRSDLAPQME